MALAHVVAVRVEAAYRRGDPSAKYRALTAPGKNIAMEVMRKSSTSGRRGAKRQPKSGALSKPAILETIFIQALAALEDGVKPGSLASVALPSPVLKLIREHAIADIEHRLLAIRIAVDRCASSTFHGGSGLAKKVTVDVAVATARKLKSLLRKIDKARGEDLVFEPIDDGSPAYPGNGLSFAVLPGPRKMLIENLDAVIAMEKRHVNAVPSKGGRPLSYLNGACHILARTLFDGRSFRLKSPDHIKLAEELFGDVFASPNGSDAVPRLRDAVARSRDAIQRRPRKTGEK